jgi:serine/threonine protein kinase
MAAGVLEALAHAHAVGMIHRDIKPENIILSSDGATKLLDFGLAKDVPTSQDVERPTATLLTEAGMIVGTVGYFSPEQLRGEPLDARSDLFAVGAVLYEAVSGRAAFPGRTPTERMAAILSKDPAPLEGPEIPAQLEGVLRRALARDPAYRYANAAAFLSDLRLLGSGELISPLSDTLAIVDFENLTGDPEDNWIGSGVAETLTADLGRVSGLTSSATPSRFRRCHKRISVSAGHGLAWSPEAQSYIVF